MSQKASLYGFSLLFADHQVEYIVSLIISHCFILRIKFCAQEAYSEICEIYVPQKLLHIYCIPLGVDVHTHAHILDYKIF